MQHLHRLQEHFYTDDNNLGVVMAVDIYNLVGSSKNIGPQISNTLMSVEYHEFSASPGVMSGESVYFHALISAVSAIRFINNNAASTTPISIATTRSKNTVKKKVATRTMMSLFGAVLQRRKKESSPPYLRQPQEEQRLKWSLGSMQQAASKPEE